MRALEAETAAAVAAVREVVPILLGRQGAEDVRAKAPGDLVTASDLLIEATLQRRLAERCPEVAFVGEEGAQALPAGGRVWLVDPLCGTANYAAGLRLYAINVALVEDGQVLAAVVADGATGELYVAERGRGAWRLEADQVVHRLDRADQAVQRVDRADLAVERLDRADQAVPRRGGNDQAVRPRGGAGQAVPLRVSPASGLVSVDPTLAAPGALHDFGRQFAIRVLGDGRFRVRVLSTTLVLPLLASGQLAAAVYGNAASPVHLAAGLLLAEEAGALVTDQHGAAWQLASPVLVIAASAALQQDLLPLVQATYAALV
jgi:myo-inositol-1(or 4)-monophosphatase